MANVEPPSPKFMRPRRYAERVGINWRSIYHYVDIGALPSYKFQGVLLLDVEECDSVLKGLERRLAPVRKTQRKTKRRKEAAAA
jgi:hypothetical protein